MAGMNVSSVGQKLPTRQRQKKEEGDQISDGGFLLDVSLEKDKNRNVLDCTINVSGIQLPFCSFKKSDLILIGFHSDETTILRAFQLLFLCFYHRF